MEESILQIISAAFLILGTMMGLLTDWVITPYVYSIGAAGAILYSFQMSLQHKNDKSDKQRLHRIFVLVSCSLAGAAYLLFCGDNNWWIAITLIYATMVLYTSFRNSE